MEADAMTKTMAPPPFSMGASPMQTSQVGGELEDDGMTNMLAASAFDTGGFAQPPEDGGEDQPVQRVRSEESDPQTDPNGDGDQNGLPMDLRKNMEAMSGLDLSDVRVHYNSSQPANLQAHAFARGNEIFLGPGQSKHLPHETWHVVQQKQGRVKATGNVSGEALNDDPQLELEADQKGNEAQAMDAAETTFMMAAQEEKQSKDTKESVSLSSTDAPVQRVLIGKADGLRERLTDEANALSMLDIIKDWSDAKQNAFLLTSDDSLAADSVLKEVLSKTYLLYREILNKPNFLSLFQMTLQDAVDEGSNGTGLYNKIKRPFSGIFKGNIEGNYDWINNGKEVDKKKGTQTAEALLGEYLKREGQRGIVKGAKELRDKVGGRHGLADKLEGEKQEFLEINKLEYISRKKKELTEKLALIPEEDRSDHQERMFEIMDDHLKQLESWEPWQEKYQQTARKIERMNAEMLTAMQDNSKRVSPKVHAFLEAYKIGEVNSEYTKQVDTVEIQEKPTTDFNKLPEQKDTTGYVVNIITGKGRTKPKEVADQYYNQAFDAGSFGGEEKRATEAPYRMTMVMGVNLFDTIDQDGNNNREDVKKFVKEEGVTDKFPMASFGFVWRPNWVNKAGKAVGMEPLRAAYADMDGAEKAQVRAYERESVTKIQENIPYGSLRDTVTASTYTQNQVQFLSKYNKQAYIYSGDDDAPSLKLDKGKGEKGVFTRADQVMADLDKHPLMLTGGYQFGLGKGDARLLDPDKPGDYLTYLADVLNQAIRGFLANGLSVYPTEPSLFVKAYEKKKDDSEFKLFGNDNLFEGDEGSRTLKKDKTMWGDGAGEGRALRKNLLSAVPKEERDVVFDQNAGVLTDPGRFKLGNDAPVPSKHYAFDPANKRTFEELRKLHSTSDPKKFMAQVLADFVLQNQSMSDRRTLAREMRDALKLKRLGMVDELLLDKPDNDNEKLERELTALMIHNNKMMKKVYELSKLGEDSGPTYDEYLKHLRFKFGKKEDFDELTAVDPTVTPGTDSEPTKATYSTKTSGKELKPDIALEAETMVARIMDQLKDLKVGDVSFWVKLKETMDAIVKEADL